MPSIQAGVRTTRPHSRPTWNAEIYLLRGGWVWIYSAAPTILQGAEAGTDANVLETKLSHKWHSRCESPFRRQVPVSGPP